MMTALTWTLLFAAPCFVPSDATPGWKQVALPDDAPSLSAPVDIEQFRSGELITVVEELRELFLAGEQVFPGRTTFEFALGQGGHSLEVLFARPLRGAKVDVTASSSEGTLQLMHEQRVGGDRLRLSWGENDVHFVRVRIHQHLRAAPTVREFRAVRRVRAASLHDSETFQLARSLYYLQPRGPPVTLCEDQTLVQSVRAHSPASEARPTPVSLRRL